MMQKWTDNQEKQVRISFAGTATPEKSSAKSRQLPLQAALLGRRPAKKPKYKFEEIDTPIGKVIHAGMLLGATSSTTETPVMAVLKMVVDALENLQLLEAIYGYISDNKCEIVGIANTLTDEQRDLIWDTNWDYQGRYPHINIEVLLIQRYDRPLVELYNGDSAIIQQIAASA